MAGAWLHHHELAGARGGGDFRRCELDHAVVLGEAPVGEDGRVHVGRHRGQVYVQGGGVESPSGHDAIPADVDQRGAGWRARRGLHRHRHPAVEPWPADCGARGLAALPEAVHVLRRGAGLRLLPPDRRAPAVRVTHALAGLDQHADPGVARHPAVGRRGAADVAEPRGVLGGARAGSRPPNGAGHVGHGRLRAAVVRHRGAALLERPPARQPRGRHAVLADGLRRADAAADRARVGRPRLAALPRRSDEAGAAALANAAAVASPAPGRRVARLHLAADRRRTAAEPRAPPRRRGLAAPDDDQPDAARAGLDRGLDRQDAVGQRRALCGGIRVRPQRPADRAASRPVLRARDGAPGVASRAAPHVRRGAGPSRLADPRSVRDHRGSDRRAAHQSGLPLARLPGLRSRSPRRDDDAAGRGPWPRVSTRPLRGRRARAVGHDGARRGSGSGPGRRRAAAPAGRAPHAA